MAKRILIVEDDPELQALYGFMLSGEQYDVDPVYDGGEALKLLGKRRPDLILLDLLLDDMSGNRFFRAIKHDARYAAIPVVIATVLPPEACRGLLALAPNTRLLRKPFSKADLIAALGGATGPTAESKARN